MEDIAEWLRAFIVSFREGVDKLSQDEKLRIQPHHDFSKPCQILFLLFRDINIQYLFCTHDGNRKDMEIEVKNPFPLFEAVGKMESILKDPKWNMHLSKEEKQTNNVLTFPEIIGNSFVGVINDIRRGIFQKQPVRGFPQCRLTLTSKSFTWTIRGNIAQTDRKILVNSILDPTKSTPSDATTDVYRGSIPPSAFRTMYRSFI